MVLHVALALKINLNQFIALNMNGQESFSETLLSFFLPGKEKIVSLQAWTLQT